MGESAPRTGQGKQRLRGAVELAGLLAAPRLPRKMSAVSRLGSLWVAAIALAGIAVLLAGGYVLVIGGVFDLLGGRTLSSGSAWLDERNRTFVLRHGRQATGALKLVLGLAWIVFTPAAVSLLNLPGRKLVTLGPQAREKSA